MASVLSFSRIIKGWSELELLLTAVKAISLKIFQKKECG